MAASYKGGSHLLFLIKSLAEKGRFIRQEVDFRSARFSSVTLVTLAPLQSYVQMCLFLIFAVAINLAHYLYD